MKRSGFAIAGLLVGAFATGCGTATSTGGTAAGDDQYIRLLSQISGTAAEVNGAEFIEYDVYRDGFTQCMAQVGFDYPQRPFNPPEPDGDVSVRLGTEWLEPPAADLDIAEEKVAHRLDSRDWARSPYFDLTDERQKQYDAALDGCIKLESAWTVNAVPNSAYVLHMALRVVIEDIERGLATDGYGPCMREQGFEVNSYSELHSLIWASMPPVSQAPAAVDAGNAAWQEAVALERTAAAADRLCRADIYADGVDRLSERLPAFESRFAQQLAAVSDEWAQVLAQADRRSGDGFCSVCRQES